MILLCTTKKIVTKTFISNSKLLHFSQHQNKNKIFLLLRIDIHKRIRVRTLVQTEFRNEMIILIRMQHGLHCRIILPITIEVVIVPLISLRVVAVVS